MQSEIGVLILAAGASRRLGRPKANLQWCGKSLLAHTISQGRRLGSPLHVVTGSHYPLIRFRSVDQPDRWVFNARWPEGMASSLQAGLMSMPGSVKGVYVLLVDQPAIEACFWSGLITAVERSGGGQPVAADLGGFVGAPAYLPRWLWPDIMDLQGDAGAGKLLRSNGAIAVPAPGAKVDVDTRADWLALRQSDRTALNGSE
ncbi:nucleotidyltransferase family protein [Marinobacter nanhaiticus D15-8W]|uniref:Nucleotidyltransferase family protein n=1 Tax=Marinobacter nanhaiticus D15-8W TaxID=626887 RepID=N6WXS5_9GAMM|nr:nucleotidyltransferase family protein [Marinobacter nanhaiticus]ENO13588.2 nucleotidyltransferase family protein [Marinobacter nanhaiticus D15-8W]BES70959.1 nucleotidyltransferase family protein [Marinobacter nanhaiticus D15-8W]